MVACAAKQNQRERKVRRNAPGPDVLGSKDIGHRDRRLLTCRPLSQWSCQDKSYTQRRIAGLHLFVEGGGNTAKAGERAKGDLAPEKAMISVVSGWTYVCSTALLEARSSAFRQRFF